MTSRWVCPRCEREFDRPHQAHVCAPGVDVEAWFADRPTSDRAIYDAIMDRLPGDVHVDAVSVGVFLKAQRKIAELRPRQRGRMALYLILPRPLETPRSGRPEKISLGRWGHRITLTGPDDVDDELGGWLAEAYAAAI
jgi:hypothetical protein